MSEKANNIKNTNSMDFLGQKRRIRPVRKVQVSTHFDELDLKSLSSETPEPPGLDSTENMAILKDETPENSYKDDNSIATSEPKLKSAVYACKAPSSPVELNTLVPEDFNFGNFNLSDSKKEDVKTDLTFQALSVKADPKTTEISADTKSTDETDFKESADEKKPTSTAVVGKTTDVKPIKMATYETTQSTAVNDEISESESKKQSENLEKEHDTITKKDSKNTNTIDRDFLLKVSEARKSLQLATEASNLSVASGSENLVNQNIANEEYYSAPKNSYSIDKSESSAIIPPKRPTTPEKKLQVLFTREMSINSLSVLEEESKSPDPSNEKPLSASPSIVKSLSSSPSIIKSLSPSPSIIKSLSPSPSIVKSLSPSPSIVKSISPSPSIVKSISPSPSIVKSISPSPSIVKSNTSSRSRSSSRISAKTSSILSNSTVNEKIKSKITLDPEEVSAPPPLPTNVSHLLEIRNSFKPSLLPVKPVNGPPSVENEQEKEILKSPTISETLPAYSSPLSRSGTGITAADLEALRKELEQQKLKLEQEINSKSVLEFRFESLLSKSGAQEEALKYKNEKLERIESDYLQVKNDLVSMTNEKLKLDEKLAKAEEELKNASETNAKAYLEMSDEINALKDKLAAFAAIIGQNNKTIDSLTRQIEEIKRNNLQLALESVRNHEGIEDELIKMIEEEILRMQDTIEEQRSYNATLQMEVDAEYKFWKQALKEDIDTVPS